MASAEHRRFHWATPGWLPLALAFGLLLALALFRTFAFNHRKFDNVGGSGLFNRGSTESDTGDPPQGAGYGDVGGVKDHP